MATYEVLPALPPSGPLAVQVPSGAIGSSEGLVVRFDGAEPWVGNFRRGGVQFDCVLPHPNQEHVIVIAGGRGYLVDPEHRDAISAFGDDIVFAREFPALNAVVIADRVRFEAIAGAGRLWISERISWDGFRKLEISDGQLNGEAFSPLDEAWHAFSLDLRTGLVQGAVFAQQTANKRQVRPR